MGYIIGPRIAGILLSGGVFSWLVLMPAIRFFGSLAPNQALYPSTIPIPQMSSDQLWSSYIRPMGAGAVAAAGVITLAKTMPTIWAALTTGLKEMKANREGRARVASRIEHDLPMKFVVIGAAAVAAMIWIDRKSTRLNSSHLKLSRMPSSA